MKSVIVIPARLGARRLPNKPILEIAGVPLVIWTWRNADATPNTDAIIATDSPEIVEIAKEYGARAVLTDAAHRSGSDRVAEVVSGGEWDYVVNLQADEPFVGPDLLTPLLDAVRDASEMATLATPIVDREEFLDPNVVKVVESAGRAVYFSRSPIPYAAEGVPVGALRHLGIYAFKREALLAFSGASPEPLEIAENLEQLRALSIGFQIAVIKTDAVGRGIDTPDDLAWAQTHADALPSMSRHAQGAA